MKAAKVVKFADMDAYQNIKQNHLENVQSVVRRLKYKFRVFNDEITCFIITPLYKN